MSFFKKYFTNSATGVSTGTGPGTVLGGTTLLWSSLGTFFIAEPELALHILDKMYVYCYCELCHSTLFPLEDV